MIEALYFDNYDILSSADSIIPQPATPPAGKVYQIWERRQAGDYPTKTKRLGVDGHEIKSGDLYRDSDDGEPMIVFPVSGLIGYFCVLRLDCNSVYELRAGDALNPGDDLKVKSFGGLLAVSDVKGDCFYLIHTLDQRVVFYAESEKILTGIARALSEAGYSRNAILSYDMNERYPTLPFKMGQFTVNRQDQSVTLSYKDQPLGFSDPVRTRSGIGEAVNIAKHLSIAGYIPQRRIKKNV